MSRKNDYKTKNKNSTPIYDTGERHGPRYYVVINEASRQRQKYIPQSQVSAAQQGIAEYQRAQEIIAEITRINLELIKERAYAGS